MIEREGLEMVYALQKFCHYLLGGHFKMFTDHSALKYLVNNLVLGGIFFRWLLLLQEFDFEIIVKSGWLNSIPDHLSRIETGKEPSSIKDVLPDARLFNIRMLDDYYEQIIQFLMTCKAPKDFTMTQKT